MTQFFKKFNFPFNTQAINLRELQWFKQYKDYIHSIYISPYFIYPDFIDISSGYSNTTEFKKTQSTNIKYLEYLKEQGILINIIFNNPYIKYNLDYIYTKLSMYEYLIDIVTIPRLTQEWISLKSKFILKNSCTLLPTFNQVQSGIYDCLDIIQLHDNIIHNHDKWKSIKGNRKFSCLVNIGCTSDCTIKQIHYYEIFKGYSEEQFCPIAHIPFELNYLRRAAIPEFKSEYVYYLDVIDEYKLAGRGSVKDYQKCKYIIEQIEQDNFCTITTGITKQWMERVRNCGGKCSMCTYCENLIQGCKGIKYDKG